MLYREKPRKNLVWGKTRHTQMLKHIHSVHGLHARLLPTPSSHVYCRVVSVIYFNNLHMDRGQGRNYRVAMADFWRTYHHGGKISPGW